MSIKVLGLNSVLGMFGSLKKSIEEASTIGIKDATLMMVGEVKQSIAGRKAELRSVDTGRFLNSVNYELNYNYGKVYSDLDYAKYLEYGTSKITARRHFRNSLDRNRKKINQIFKDKISKSVRLRGTTKL